MQPSFFLKDLKTTCVAKMSAEPLFDLFWMLCVLWYLLHRRPNGAQINFLHRVVLVDKVLRSEGNKLSAAKSIHVSKRITQMK